MANLTLWETVKELKSPKYKWVDLTAEPRDPALVRLQASGGHQAL